MGTGSNGIRCGTWCRQWSALGQHQIARGSRQGLHQV